MSSLREYRCEICGRVTNNPQHWFMIDCGASRLSVSRWEPESASLPDTRHLCGEADAQVYISRWFQSFCAPPKPDYSTMRSGSSVRSGD
jgi:hypothetical protein